MSNCTDSTKITAYFRWFLNTLTHTAKSYLTFTSSFYITELCVIPLEILLSILDHEGPRTCGDEESSGKSRPRCKRAPTQPSKKKKSKCSWYELSVEESIATAAMSDCGTSARKKKLLQKQRFSLINRTACRVKNLIREKL